VRFKVKHPTGAEHEVELEGTVAVLGRDPSCDLVLNDAKCSRRHAVLEAGPQGIAIRDAGSANGVYVNGHKAERASLKEGDVVQLGEVLLTVLAEEVPGTLVMGPEDMPEVATDAAPARLTPAARPPAPGPPPVPPAAPPKPAAARPAPPPPRPVPQAPPPRPPSAPGSARLNAPMPRPPSVRPAPLERPLTVSLLASLWAFSALLYLVLAGVAFPLGLRGTQGLLAVVGGVTMALVSVLMAYGLFAMASWARMLQIVFAFIGLCHPFLLASVAILAYMLRSDVALRFSTERGLAPDELEALRRGAPEGLFSGVILAGLALPILIIGAVAAVSFPSLVRGRESANQAATVGDLRTMISAQAAFSVVCDGYGDLEALVQPGTVIGDYASGPQFLPPAMAQAERHAYRFELATDAPMPSRRCQRAFKGYRYSAAPLSGGGRQFLALPDGTIHVASGRPATPNDPPLP